MSVTRIHLSRIPITKVRRGGARGSQSIEDKPDGLWYGCGREWADWVKTEMPSTNELYKYAYEVILKRNARILFLSKVSGFDAFEEKYTPSQHRRGSHFIDWNAVSLDYDGIEICPYQWSERLRRSWYYTWDVASGCIWNNDAIERLVELEGMQR